MINLENAVKKAGNTDKREVGYLIGVRDTEENVDSASNSLIL